jgi:phosphoribosyl isomerase A
MLKRPFVLLPLVTISGGKALLAPKGYGESTESGTPAQAISSWVGQGAPWVHVIDQDAVDGSAPNLHHVVPSGAHLQYSGRIVDEPSLAAALTTGASRVVIDVTDLEWACSATREHGERVAVGLDIRQPDVFEVGARLESSGCSRFVITDQAQAHHWKHGDRHLLEEFCMSTNKPVIARGGVSHLGDLHALHELVPHGLEGVVLDEGLYSGAFTYSEAVAAGADRFDMFYWGPPQ